MHDRLDVMRFGDRHAFVDKRGLEIFLYTLLGMKANRIGWRRLPQLQNLAGGHEVVFRLFDPLPHHCEDRLLRRGHTAPSPREMPAIRWCPRHPCATRTAPASSAKDPPARPRR